MGLFDYLDFRMDCPYCGKTIRDFQTKDHDDPAMTILRPYQPLDIEPLDGKKGKSLRHIVLSRVTNWYTSHTCYVLDEKELWFEWFVDEKGAHCEVRIPEDVPVKMTSTGPEPLVISNPYASLNDE